MNFVKISTVFCLAMGLTTTFAMPANIQEDQQGESFRLYRMFSPFDGMDLSSKEAKDSESLTTVSNNTPAIPQSNKQKKQIKSQPVTKNPIISALTTPAPSALETRIKKEETYSLNPFGIMFYEPTYILPFYYTSSPYGAVYRGQTPNNQQISPDEFKAQLSIKVPIVRHLLGKHSSLYLGYTQLSYWQFYSQSQYFRETNYEPTLFWTDQIVGNWWFNLGVVHQSNGRGGAMERSWNRAFVNIMFSGKHWMVSLKPWVLIFKKESSDIHNPKIARYLGHGRLLFAYKIDHNEFSLMLRNNIESGFKRGAMEFNYNFPIYGALSGYAQFFAGYGQSLIEYDHSTKGAGIGIALSNWI